MLTFLVYVTGREVLPWPANRRSFHG